MISRRNFLMITVIMFVLLGLFMFTEAAKLQLNEYDTNPYADVDTSIGGDSVYQVTDSTESSYCIFVGETGNLYDTVYQWSTYHRSNLCTYTSCADVTVEEDNPPEFLILQGSAITEADVEVMGSWISNGYNIIFGDMPDLELIQSSATLRSYLGIVTVKETEVDLTGVILHKGFLLGGTGDYIEDTEEELDMQDLELSMPWYVLSSGTKVYINGQVEDDLYLSEFGEDNFNNYRNAFLPGILWRASVETAKVFVVNGDYLETETGIGILYAMENEVSGFQIYPVINAQSTVMTAYPTFAYENADELENVYSRTSIGVIRDLIWPGLVEVMTNTGGRMTFMLQTKIDASASVEQQDFQMLMEFLGVQEAEAGLNVTGTGTLSALAQLEEDRSIYDAWLSDYVFTTAYGGDADASTVLETLQEAGYEDVSTLLLDYDSDTPLFQFTEDQQLVLTSVNTASSHTYSEDLRARSMETAFAYSLITEDLSKVLYPETEEDEWQNLFEKISSYCISYFEKFDAFTELTLSETGERVRDYFDTEYEVERDGKVITLSASKDSGYYIFRTHGEEIEDITGASYVELEDDAYLLTLEDTMVTITMDKESEVYYYEGN